MRVSVTPAGFAGLVMLLTGNSQKVPAPSLAAAAAILEDEARLIRGHATSIDVSALLDIAEIIRQRG